MENIPLILAIQAIVVFSAVCSGLNVGLMSLSTEDLRRKAKLGNRRAKLVLPLRRNSHLSLASILLSNIAAISAVSLLLGDRFSGLVAGIISTLLIVVFGEVLPQAIFSRYALSFSAFFTPLLRIMIILTYPVAKPLQLLLDALLGHPEKQLHSRRELGVIIREHNNEQRSELDQDEVEIIQNTLQLSTKQVREIMTPIKSVYWLKSDSIIDAASLDELKARQWSRIPVFDGKLKKCHGVLLLKDLLDIDFDSRPQPVSTLKLHPARVIGSKTALDTLFRYFIGSYSHLMPVEKSGKIVGIVTIEDLIEEIIGHEIEDESDPVKQQS